MGACNSYVGDTTPPKKKKTKILYSNMNDAEIYKHNLTVVPSRQGVSCIVCGAKMREKSIIEHFDNMNDKNKKQKLSKPHDTTIIIKYKILIQSDNGSYQWVAANSNYIINGFKLDINFHHIVLVEGYMRDNNLFIPEAVIDLIIFFYAKPLIMKLNYHNELRHILYCPVQDSWQSIYKKLSKMSRANILQISYKNQSVAQDNWMDFTWNEQECFEIITDWTPESIEWEKKLNNVAKAVDKTDILIRGKIWDKFDRKNVEKLDCDKSLSRLIYSLIALYIKVKDRNARPPRFNLLKPLLISMCQDIKTMINSNNNKNENNNYITKHDFQTYIAVYLKNIAYQRKQISAIDQIQKHKQQEAFLDVDQPSNFQFSNNNLIEMAEFFEEDLSEQSKRKLWIKTDKNMSSLIEKNEMENFLYFCILVYIKAKYENVRLPKKSDKTLFNTILKPLERWLLHYKISPNGLTFDEFDGCFPDWLREYYREHSKRGLNKYWTQESIEWEKKLQHVAEKIDNTDDEIRGKIWDKFDRKKVGKLDCDKSLSRLIYSLIALYIITKDRNARPPTFNLLKPLLISICLDIKQMINSNNPNIDNNYITKHDFQTHIAVYLKKIAHQRSGTNT